MQLPKIEYPIVIWPRYPPVADETLLVADDGEAVQTAADVPSLVNVPDKPRSKVDALAIARIIVARKGCVGVKSRKVMTGTIPDPTLQNAWDKANGHFDQIRKSIHGDLYGSKSYLRDFIKGEVSHEECIVDLTNWSLAIKFLSIVPAGETAKQRKARERQIQEYRDAISTVGGMIRKTYKTAQEHAQKVAAKSDKSDKSLKEKSQALRRVKFFADIQTQEFVPDIDDTLSTEAEIEAAVMTHLCFRDKNIRLAFWSQKTDNLNFWASFFGHVGNQVDIRALFNHARFRKLWKWRLPATCDLIFVNIIIRDAFQCHCQRKIENVTIRAVAQLESHEKRTIETILDLDSFINSSKYPNWQEVPILHRREHEAVD